MDLASSGWFVQVILDKLLSAIASWSSDAHLLGALKRLEDSTKKICIVLTITQNVWVENEGLLELLKNLKDAAYDTDDLLDELDYRHLQEAAEGDDDKGDNKVSDFLYNKFKTAMALVRPWGLTNNNETHGLFLVGCDEATIDRINKIVERLDCIKGGLGSALKLLQREKLSSKPHGFISSEDRLTTSLLISEHTVLGRDTEKDMIIELLLNPATFSASRSKVSVLPIVGVGGIGKTTIVRLVYNNKRVKEYFDRLMWVCVSDNFDVVRITHEMLESSGFDLPTNPDRLQEVLKEKLSVYRFLLVLDDVWNDKEMTKWEMLCASLGSGKLGSRILMTTRLETVVKMVGGKIDTMSSIKIKGLPDLEYWSLFKNYAFGGEDPRQHDPDLEKIGRLIVRKLSGSPLAAKTVGGLLRERIDVDHWRSIMESDKWKLRHDPDDIMPVLRLSYQRLPPHLKQCFA